MKYLILATGLLLPFTSMAAGGGTGGKEFETLYNFIHGAATGYLGRSVAIAGGLIGLGLGAAAGKIMIAASGVGLAIFGVYGPKIINQFFISAII